MNIQPLENEIDNVRGQATGAETQTTPEPSHIHIPRPSRVRLERPARTPEQGVLEQAA